MKAARGWLEAEQSGKVKDEKNLTNEHLGNEAEVGA
jgi:hypothetical protein